MKLFSMLRRFLLVGLVGSILTAIVLPQSAWGIGYLREGDQLYVANTSSPYYYISVMYLYYGVPISFFVTAISAVVGKKECGALLGVAGTGVFVISTGGLPYALTGIGLWINGVVAAYFICCGVTAAAIYDGSRAK